MARRSWLALLVFCFCAVTVAAACRRGGDTADSNRTPSRRYQPVATPKPPSQLPGHATSRPVLPS